MRVFTLLIFIVLGTAVFQVADAFKGKSSHHTTARAKKAFASDSAPTYILYSQCDPRWADQVVGNKTDISLCSDSSPVGSQITSLAMALSGFNAELNSSPVTPSSLSTWLDSHDGLIFGPMEDQISVNWTSINDFGVMTFYGEFHGENAMPSITLDRYLGLGYPILFGVRGASHYVLCTSTNYDETYNCYDPFYPTSIYPYTDIKVSVVFTTPLSFPVLSKF